MNHSIYRAWINILKVLVIVFIVITFSCYWIVNRDVNFDKQYSEYASKLNTLSERYIRYAGEFVNEGKESSYDTLKEIIDEMTDILVILKRGAQDSVGNIILPPSPASIQNKELAETTEFWETFQSYSKPMIDNKIVVTTLYSTVKNLTTSIDKIQNNLLKVMNILARKENIPGTDYDAITEQLYQAQVIDADIRGMLDYVINLEKITKELPRTMNAFEANLNMLLKKYDTDPIYSIFLDTAREFTSLKVKTVDLISQASILVKIYDNWIQLQNTKPIFSETVSRLEKAYLNISNERILNPVFVLLLSIFTFFLLIALIFLLYWEQRYINRKLEKEISTLIDEIQDLSSGNLTLKASVSGEVTASIAKAVNFSVDALKEIVNNINYTSQKVTYSMTNVTKIMRDLVKLNQSQTGEIVNSADSASVMSTTLEQVASNVQQSAEIVKNSVEIALEGSRAVNSTIKGMERIREEIQETEIRMQRLTDSSIEINEIVSIMDAISERTNILSLNAAIQASMVGEMGAGFAIVADEVQMLAIKSSQSVKEVETIVTTIQADTTRATRAMENAIREVYAGTQLANNAGHALEKVENVSKILSEIIHQISNATQETAHMSNKISKTMELIESIARQTANGSETTAEALENLSNLIQTLHQSVSQFKT